MLQPPKNRGKYIVNHSVRLSLVLTVCVDVT